ncbi:pneumococcal serine-rich repeat protein [Drosophila albomicans]|uniref:Pneumococcal serine-rich repeat protein n=1 Tax=Drosophila albomicans TaxID=7291 RepID=A0A6P8XBD5_DROAB|nr:pneumococcal serine-rich repeat protein [Drosophila albomicans]
MAAAAAAMPAANTTTTAATTTPTPANPNAPAINASSSSSSNAAQFREIHKNTWLKRLTADGKKLTVGPKKSECSWVVFCVHDDTDALLEGYAEPRQAAAHMPEWAVSLRDTLHISHALIPNSHEFEFVVTLSNEVLRFHAVSWEIMQEWVETLRSKLREMKILSPRENLYTKLPEVRAPLLPTRDPTSPLPAPPPVPAAIVPGVERIPAHQHQQQQQQHDNNTSRTAAASTITTSSAPSSVAAQVIEAVATTTTTVTPPTTAMSNTLTQHLLNMLSDPISTYSEQISESLTPTAVEELDEEASATAATEPQNVTASDNILSDDEFLSPILRNGVRVDVAAASAQRISADQIMNFEQMLQCERLIPRPQTSRSMSAGAADKTKRPLRKSPQPKTQQAATNSTAVEETADNNITIIQVSNTNAEIMQPPELPPKNKVVADIFRFPEINSKTKMKNSLQSQQKLQNDYKSNVQIIPSNSVVNSNTIQVLSQPSSSGSVSNGSSCNPYTIPLKPNASNATTTQTASNTTTVQVLADGEARATATATTTVAVYGTCYPTASASVLPSANDKPQTPKVGKKIILSANSSGITNIRINNEQTNDSNVISGNVHYEKVFLSSSIPVRSSNSSPTAMREEQPSSSHAHAIVNVENTPTPVNGSPALPRRGIVIPSQTPNNGRTMPQLTRGLTELVISTRPSRRDFHYLKMLNTPLKTKTVHKTASASANANNNIEQSVPHTSGSNGANSGQSSNVAASSAVESIEQRRRSSSTSDAQAPLQRGATVTASTQTNSQRGANNNEFVPGRNIASSAFRIQSPPQVVAASQATSSNSGNKRLTLREQQVMQLRREIMHPGGVRLNLRRKDCVGSIAWVDAFGGVWIAGWKQKEHPVLYNALHIGDQLLSIAGVSISTAAEANKIIRNTNTLFVEMLLRRIPFGRAYAIRRDREGQCLGLIRDGNTSTIVDVVPNSLAARHGLPPKTQSCDGTSLTFWILTEINGRPLNLFFKDLEIRDRLNSVGRDISILVQPSDLITKLKKQLKSLRGYKDYLVQ